MFRISLTTIYQIPGDDPDFECPNGVAWIDPPAKKNTKPWTTSRGRGKAIVVRELTKQQLQLAAHRREVCLGCKAHTDMTDRKVTCRRLRLCRSRLSLTDPATACPIGLWEPGAISEANTTAG